MKKIVHFLSLISFSLLLFTSCSNPKNNFIENTSFYKDTTNIAQVNQVQKLDFKDLKSYALGFNDATFWFKIALKKEVSKDSIYLQFKESFLKEVELYTDQDSLIYKSKQLKSSNIYIPLKHSSDTLYAKIIFEKQPFISVAAYSTAFLQQSKNTDLLERGGFYMLVGLLILINLFLAYFFKNTVFIWYVLFEANVSLGIALYDNTVASLVSNPDTINILLGLNYLLTPIASIMFCIQFLKVKQFYPKLVRFFKLLFIPLFIINCAFYATNNFEILAYGELIATVLYLSSLILGFVLIKKSDYAGYYAAGYSVLFGAGVLYSLSVNFGWTFLPLSINFLKVGVLIEIIILTFAVLLKAKTYIQEHAEMTVQLTNFVNELRQYKKKTAKDKNIQFEEKLSSIAQEYELTDRETDILLQISNGLSNQDIAEKLFISVNTVKYHMRNLYEKLDVNKRTEITAKLR